MIKTIKTIFLSFLVTLLLFSTGYTQSPYSHNFPTVSLGYTAEDVANKSINVQIDGASDIKYPSVKAVKDYTDSLVWGLLDDRGNYDASSNVFPSTGGSGNSGAILKGDIWKISVAGTLGGIPVAVNDSIRALTDTPGQTEANWGIISGEIVAGTGLTKTGQILSANLSTGIVGGQSVIGGTAASENLTISSTANATKGLINLGTSNYNEATNVLTLTNNPVFSGLTSGSILFAGASGLISQDNTNLFWDNNNKRLGLNGANPPTYNLSFGSSTNRIIGIERAGVLSSPGKSLTINAGGAFSSSSNQPGGNLYLSGGTSTGIESSYISFLTATAGLNGSSDNAPTEKWRMLGSGFFGNLAAPTSPLHLNNTSSTIPTLNLIAPNVANSPWLRFTTGANNVAEIKNNAGFVFESYINGNDNKFVTNNGDFVILNNITPLVTVKDTGFVGIGTSSPSAKLTVQGDIKIGNSVATCSETIKGSVRFNDSNKSMQYCDGIDWLEIGGAPLGTIAAFNSVCPVGWSELTEARGRTIIGAGQGSGLTNRPLSSTGGEEAIILSIDQMPSHNHTVKASADQGNKLLPTGNYLAKGWTGTASTSDYDDSPTIPVTMATDMINSTGGGLSHSNMSPYIALTWCRKTTTSGGDPVPAVTNLTDLNDVSIVLPTNGNILSYRSAIGKWETNNNLIISDAGKIGVLTTVPGANLDTSPTTITTTTYTRPFPALTTTQRNALTGMTAGVGVYNSIDKVVDLWNGTQWIPQNSQYVVYINDISDLPVPIAGEHILAAGVTYNFGDKTITSSSRLVLSGSGTSIITKGTFIYTGTGAAVKLQTTDQYLREIDHFTLIATNPTGDIFDISSSGSGVGAPIIFNALAVISPDGGATHSCRKYGTINGVTLIAKVVQLFDGEQSLDFSNIYSLDASTVQTSLFSGATGSIITFSGTNGIIQLSGFSPIVNTNQFAFYFNPAGTYSGVTVSNSVPTFLGTATPSVNTFAATSYTQKTPGFKFNGNVFIPNSTTSLAARSEGNSTTYTIIQGAGFKTLVNTGINFTGKFAERTSVATDGTITYIGLEDTTLTLDANVNVDPQTATKLLRAQAGVIKLAQRVVTFTNATDVVNETGTPRANGDTIVFKNSTGTLPTGLDKNEVYYVVNKTIDTFQVAHTLGGAPALFTTDGTGTNSYQIVDMSGSIGRASITAANPVDLITQALCLVSTGDTINLFVSNDDDAVDVLVRNVYVRIKE